MKERIFSLDLIRISACILVVMVHVSAIFFYEYPVTDSQWVIASLFNCLGITGVPLFFMLSGALLLNPDRPFSIRRFTVRHTLKILIVYILTVFLFNTLYFFLELPVKSFAVFKEEVLLNTLCLTGHNIGHLWFLPALFCLYLLTPLLRKAFDDEKICLYTLALFFILGIFVHTMLYFNFKYYRIVSSAYHNIPFELFLGYTGYFCLGHYLVHFRKETSCRFVFIFGALALTGYFFTAFGCYRDAVHTGTASSLFNEPFSIGQFLTSTGLFAILTSLFSNHKPADKAGDFLAKLTFPIYLFHPAAIILLKKMHFPFFFAPAVIAIPLEIILVIAITGGISAVFLLPFHLFRRKRS